MWLRMLTYIELQMIDEMDEEADVFSLYLLSLRVATGIKPTLGTMYNKAIAYSSEIMTCHLLAEALKILLYM